MKKTHSSLALVLDRSGSMSSCLEAAISATNHFLNDQKEAEGTADLTITLFDDRIEQPYEAIDLGEIPDFDTRTFVPRGSTALLDAIGHTIDCLGARLAALPEAERPGTVIVAILTDGYENASTHETWQSLNEKIRHQQDKYRWQFLFLAAGPDAIAQASRIGILDGNTSAYTNDSIGHAASTAAYSGKMKSIRAAAHRELTEKEKIFHESSLADLVASEDQKRRGERNTSL